MDALPLFFYLIVAAFVGLCFGSFATALIYRIPRGISWVFQDKSHQAAARSACPHCRHVLSIFDLVPVFSWLIAGGRCRYCRAKISMRYPLVELSTMLLTVSMVYAWGVEWATLPIVLSIPFLVAAFVIDWDDMILPNQLNGIFFGLSVLFVCVLMFLSDGERDVWMDHVAGGVALPLVFGLVSFVLGKIKGRDALGAGDLKFLPAAGLFLGMAALPTYLGLSGVLGLLTAFLKRNSEGKGAFPFGPALIISFYLHLFLTGMGFEYKW